MKKKFDVNFEIYDKIDVIGENVPDFWKFLNGEYNKVDHLQVLVCQVLIFSRSTTFYNIHVVYY